MTVKVKKIGGSVAVLIPKSVAQEIELREGTSLEITTEADAIIMRKRRRRARRPMSEILPLLSPAAYRRRAKEFSADKPVGKEIW